MIISAESVRFDDDAMRATLTDGRVLGIPLAWFPRLPHAAEREAVTLSPCGLHWEALDEDISNAGLAKMVQVAARVASPLAHTGCAEGRRLRKMKPYCWINVDDCDHLRYTSIAEGMRKPLDKVVAPERRHDMKTKDTRSASYEAAKRFADKKIVGRFARRNVKLQNGVFTTNLEPIIKSGDDAEKRLRSKFREKEPA